MAASRVRKGFAAFIAIALWAGLAPTIALAKEESKIKVRLENLGASSARARGTVRTMLQGRKARLHLEVGRLTARTPYSVLADGEEVATFTTRSNGQANLKVGLRDTGDSMSPPIDPRGKYLTVNDGVGDVLGAWIFGLPEDDSPGTRIKERTGLARMDPAPGSTTVAGLPDRGRAGARYGLQPNGKSRLVVSLRHLLRRDDYEVWVDGVYVETLTTNGDGNAKVSLRSHPSRGKNKGKKVTAHNKKGQLAFDPRRKLVEVKYGGQTVLSGPMLAQIDGLNVCTSTEPATIFSQLDPIGFPDASGDVKLDVDEDCDPEFEVQVEDVPAGVYDLVVDEALVATIMVALDAAGDLVGKAEFEANPDEPGEMPLDFVVQSGSVVRIEQAGVGILEAVLP